VTEAGRDLLGTSAAAPRVLLVGPLPPPAGGMANQCEELSARLRSEQVPVEVVRTNAPYRPAFVGRVSMLRAAFRLLPYVWRLDRALRRNDVVHLMANSGWAWHLFAAPVLWLARWHGVPVILNYRGGEAAAFFASAPRHVFGAIRGAAARVVPSGFLQRVFGDYALDTTVIPNLVDLSRFEPRPWREPGPTPRLLVARHLEAIYGIGTVLRAFATIRAEWPGARLTVAGDGPERESLQRLSHELGVGDAVVFCGRKSNAEMPALYADADLVLNASEVDNMPISLLEAMASGVPFVSSAAGGIPDMVDDGRTGLLAPVGDASALADKALQLLRDPQRARRQALEGIEEARRYAWERIGPMWRTAYQEAAARGPHGLDSMSDRLAGN
jgi:glycosyltransferase involved in cell wall biosynthesis